MPELHIHRKPSRHPWFCDFLFILFALFYALFAYQGILPISGNGTLMDSDLATYAQGMAGVEHPDLFANDPVLASRTPANSIHNLQRTLAAALAPPDEPAVGLLRSGAIAIFIFYCGWYLLGRRLFASPAVSAILALVCGITIWIGWGTFWGITHSDPVPRVFFAAIFPFLLLLAIISVKNAWLRPLAALGAGCSIWIHGISALNCGAMFLMAFLLVKPEGKKLESHLCNTFICVIFFLAPVLIFLYPSLSQSKSFSGGEMAVFRELFDLRWAEDYSGFWKRLGRFLSLSNPPVPIILCGFAGWGALKLHGNPEEKNLALLYPGFFLALVIMVLFCWAETRFAPNLGRLPMGHELVRGLRFLIPLSWIFIIGALSLVITSQWPRRIILFILIGALALFTADRQYVAAQYAIGHKLGIQLPKHGIAEKWKKEASSYRALMEKIRNTVPPGEAVFSGEDDMAIRYIAMRPLVHAFKDGYVFFYNKDLAGSKKWLHYEKILHKPDGLVEAWLDSDAPWLLLREKDNVPALENLGTIIFNEDGWLLARRKSGN